MKVDKGVGGGGGGEGEGGGGGKFCWKRGICLQNTYCKSQYLVKDSSEREKWKLKIHQNSDVQLLCNLH